MALVIYKHNFNSDPILYSIITARHFGFTTFLIIFGCLWWKFKLIGFSFAFGFFERFAKISYGIYVLQFPIIWLVLPTQIPWLITVVIKVSLIFILSYWAELKMQPIIDKWFYKNIKPSINLKVA